MNNPRNKNLTRSNILMLVVISLLAWLGNKLFVFLYGYRFFSPLVTNVFASYLLVIFAVLAAILFLFIRKSSLVVRIGYIVIASLMLFSCHVYTNLLRKHYEEKVVQRLDENMAVIEVRNIFHSEAEDEYQVARIGWFTKSVIAVFPKKEYVMKVNSDSCSFYQKYTDTLIWLCPVEQSE